MENSLIITAKQSFGVMNYEHTAVPGHKGGRNLVYILSHLGEKKYVLRISRLEDRTEADYRAEVEFVRYLYEGGASVVNVFPSTRGRMVEKIGDAFVCMFGFAPGMLFYDNGYRYREGAPLSEYFYNTGKTLGKIHQLSKQYMPKHVRASYFDKYNAEYMDTLIPNEYSELKAAIKERLAKFAKLPINTEVFGLVHFDFGDGNYHIDMSTGKITVFDFDNSMNCWYMYDLANLWTLGVGWYQYETDQTKRRACMKSYFDTIVAGYRSETEISDEMLDELPLFIDMVLIENIVDELECCKRANEDFDYEDIEDAAECLIDQVPYAGFC